MQIFPLPLRLEDCSPYFVNLHHLFLAKRLRRTAAGCAGSRASFHLEDQMFLGDARCLMFKERSRGGWQALTQHEMNKFDHGL